MRRSRTNPIFQSLERRTHLSRTVASAAEPVIRALAAENEAHLPRYETDAEKHQALPGGPQTIEVPGPAPTGLIDPVSEYDEMEGLVVSWTGSSSWLNNLAQISRYVTVEANGRMYIAVANEGVQASATARLEAYEVNFDNITFYTAPYNSIWARDYGPRYVYESDVRVITDHQYNITSRTLDDHIPAKFSLVKQQQIYQMGIGNVPLRHGGGNFHLATDGDAYMTDLVNDNNPGFSDEQIEQLYLDYQNDNLTITGEFPSNVDGTGHIDMWMQIYDDKKVFISDWPNNQGSIQDNICETTATLMASRGYEVTRIPAYSMSGVHYTYTNMVIFNNIVMLPQYTSGPGATVSAAALATVQDKFGDSMTVYGINANSIITAAGAFHCIVQHVPVHKGMAGANGGLAPTAFVRDSIPAMVYGGQEIDISWITDDDAVLSQTDGVQSVDIYLSTDNGATFPHTVATNQNPLGTIAWEIPYGLQSSNARLKVVATDADGNTSFDVSDIPFEIINPTSAAAMPGQADLLSVSDTGWANNDNVTLLNNSSSNSVLSFSVANTVVGARVRLYDGNTLIASTIATSTTTILETDGASTLNDGTHNIVARQWIAGYIESSAVPLQLSIDTVAPIVTYYFAFEQEQRVDAHPNEVIEMESVTLHNETDNTTLTGNQLTITPNDVSVSIRKTTGLLSNGNWNVSGNGPTDLAGNSAGAIDFDFYVLSGDANRDRTVNFNDLLIVAQHYGSAGNGFSHGNFDYSLDGLVSFSDLLIAAQSYNLSVPAALVAKQRQGGTLALLDDVSEQKRFA